MMGAEQNIVWGQKKREDFIKWDEFFMGTALLAAQRSKDPSTQVMKNLYCISSKYF